MEVQNEVVTTLMKARDILKNGWCRRKLRDGDRYCIKGAIFQACGVPLIQSPYSKYEKVTIPDSRHPKFGFAEKVIEILNKMLGMYAFLWNDAKTRTHEEVVELFDKAIEQERAKCLESV